jgi:ATP-dependent RNA helicase RhlE
VTNSTFAALGVAEPLLRALEAENYTTPTPIQLQAIPTLLDGKDILGIAQTGTGKTAAFAVPILQLLSLGHEAPKPRQAKALILAPTRELAIQISDSVGAYGQFLGIRRAVVLGGVNQKSQVKALARGVDVLIATPGRLLDLANQGHIDLSNAHTLVLDEADRMLDMGFINDVRKIIAMLPNKRQSLLFSATMPPDVAKLADKILNSPIRIEITPKVVTVDRITQQVFFVEGSDKKDMLLRIVEDPSVERAIVFTRTKHRANRVAEALDRAGHSAVAIHGNKSQNARQKALGQFKDGSASVLVATDIAARGIDVDDVTHVINYELPNEPESYVHRIGRTARAGADGTALSLCEATEVGYLNDIEKLTKKKIEVVHGEKPAAKKPIRNGGGGGGRGGGGRRSGGGRSGPGGNAQGQRANNGQPSSKPRRSKSKQRNKSGGQSTRRAA